MALRALAGGKLKVFKEAQVERIDGKEKLLWRAVVSGERYEPYLKILSPTEIPELERCTFRGEIVRSNGNLCLLAEDFYWGTGVSVLWTQAKVLKTVERGSLYLCESSGVKFFFKQVEGIPLQEGSFYLLEGNFSLKREREFWNLTVEGKPIE